MRFIEKIKCFTVLINTAKINLECSHIEQKKLTKLINEI